LIAVRTAITPRGGDGVQTDVTEHVRHEAQALEYFSERGVPDARAAGIGSAGS